MAEDVVVIGAGAAGIFAAWRAATLGARVLLLEKTVRIGTKILISGGGKCNITHAGTVDELLRAFRANEARFLRPACYRFRNADVLEMFTSRGLKVYTRPDGRVFPVDQTAKDVVKILRSYLDVSGVCVRLSTPVVQVRRVDGGFDLETPGEGVRARHLIVAVGGSSYPSSGTTGDGWKWCRALGHQIVRPIAALAPIYLHVSEDSARLSGVALRDCVLKARQAGREIARWRGDLLYTHHGISGPTALGISRVVAERLPSGQVDLEVDVAPDRSFEQLRDALIAYGQTHPRRMVQSFVEELVPERLAFAFLSAAGIGHDLAFHALEKRSRNRLVEVLKALPLGPVRTVPLEKGEVVAGGVSLDEVDPHTMRSKLVPNLYLCGEVLDIAGPVGGYNLQAAFSTGFVAGETAARDAMARA